MRSPRRCACATSRPGWCGTWSPVGLASAPGRKLGQGTRICDECLALVASLLSLPVTRLRPCGCGGLAERYRSLHHIVSLTPSAWPFSNAKGDGLPAWLRSSTSMSPMAATSVLACLGATRVMLHAYGSPRCQYTTVVSQLLLEQRDHDRAVAERHGAVWVPLVASFCLGCHLLAKLFDQIVPAW